MTPAIILSLYVSLLFWLIAMSYFWKYRKERIQLLHQLSLITTEKKKKKEKLSTRGKRLLFRLANKFSSTGRRFPLFLNLEELERKIALAGHPQGLHVGSFLGLRFVLILLSLFLGNFLALIGLGGILQILLIVAAVFGLQLWIRSAAKKRQEQIGLDLPDFLDAMSVTLQAGTPMDPALKQVISNLEGPLSEEMERFFQELNLGVARDDAYHRLMNRNNCKELETLVLSLLQGSRLGVPISNTFRVLAEDMRATRIGKVKEKAAKIGPKITLVSSMLILPGVILTVMGLLILHLIETSGIGKMFS